MTKKNIWTIIGLWLLPMAIGGNGKEEKMKIYKLTPEEERVIVHKATEPPFSGLYEHFPAKGTYVCKRCRAPLYRFQDKFDSGCGWPANRNPVQPMRQVNRQGPDIGEQYRSEIFYLDDQQKRIGEKLILILKDKGYRVATRLSPAGPFWKAGDDHQKYYQKKRGTPYCHIYTKRF